MRTNEAAVYEPSEFELAQEYATPPAAIQLIACGYLWECPECYTENHTDVIPKNDQALRCASCGLSFRVQSFEHSHRI